MKNDGGNAFPVGDPTHGGNSGMSFRDWFAGMALQGILGDHATINQIKDAVGPRNFAVQCAIMAYENADAMLVERAK